MGGVQNVSGHGKGDDNKKKKTNNIDFNQQQMNYQNLWDANQMGGWNMQMPANIFSGGMPYAYGVGTNGMEQFNVFNETCSRMQSVVLMHTPNLQMAGASLDPLLTGSAQISAINDLLACFGNLGTGMQAADVPTVEKPEEKDSADEESEVKEPAAKEPVAKDSEAKNTETKEQERVVDKGTAKERETAAIDADTARKLQAASDAFAKRHQQEKAERKESTPLPQNPGRDAAMKNMVDKKNAEPERQAKFNEIDALYKQLLDNVNNNNYNYYSKPNVLKRIKELEANLSPNELAAYKKAGESYNRYVKFMNGEKVFEAPKVETDPSLPQNNGRNAAMKIMADKKREEYIKNPHKGSTLALLYARKSSLESMPASQRGAARGTVGDLDSINEQIRMITSGAKERELKTKIAALENETKDYGETHWYNFQKNAKLDELERAREELRNLF